MRRLAFAHAVAPARALAVALALGLLAPGAPARAVEELVVHITKREETEDRVPASLATFDREELELRSVERLSDALGRVPNVEMQGENGPIAVRGIAPTQVSGAPGGVASPVAQHVNGIFKPQGELSYAGQFYDLEQLVLSRGPSGTVYGRSATAGALDVRWRAPHDQYELFGDVTGARPDGWLLRSGVNVPLFGEGDDRLLARIVVQRERADGFQDDPYLNASRDPRNADDWSARAYLTSRLHADVQAELRASFHRSEALTGQGKPAIDTFPMGVLATPFGEFPTDPFAGAEPVSGDPFEVRSRSWELGDPLLRVRALDGSVRWRAPELPGLGRAVVTLLGGFEEREQESVFDTDGTELVIADGRVEQEATTWTGELRAETDPTEERYHAVAGVFAFQDRQHDDSASLTPFGPFDVTGRTRDRGLGVFVSGGVRPLALAGVDGPDLELFGGVRWNRDEVRVEESIVPGPLSPGGALDGESAFEEWTGEAGLRWQLNPLHSAYLKWARGYKPGLLELVIATGTTNAVDPEIVDTWEIGTRHRILGGRMGVNLTGFYSEYADLQVLQIKGLQVLTENAAEATIWGIEASVDVQPVPGWRVELSGAYLDASFDRFCSDDPAQFFAVSEPGCPPVATGTSYNGLSNLSGNRLQDAPRFKVSLFATGSWSLGRFGTLQPVIETTWTDARFLRPYNMASDRQDAFWSTDLRLVWTSASGHWSLELFGSNLENEAVYGRRSVLPEFAGGFPTGLGLLPARRVGVRLGVAWGGPS